MNKGTREGAKSAPDSTELFSTLASNRRKATCGICREVPVEIRSFIGDALRRGYSLQEVAAVLAPHYGEVVQDLQRHRKNAHDQGALP